MIEIALNEGLMTHLIDITIQGSAAVLAMNTAENRHTLASGIPLKSSTDSQLRL